MTVCSFDTPIFNKKKWYIVYITNRCNKWQSLISHIFRQEKKNYSKKRDFS